MKKLATIALFLSCMACTDPPETRRVLEQNGYTDIQIGGYATFSCSDKDTYATSFRATSPSGQKVSGAVCSGLFKGHTIRFD